MSWRRAEPRGAAAPARPVSRPLAGLLAMAWVVGWQMVAQGQAKPTAGYPEPIVQWGVQQGETCASIAEAMYGSAAHAPLLLRYNRIVCVRGAPLRAGLTLVLPATVTTVPTARITSVNPHVRARPPGGGWSTAGSGQPLSTNSNVHTLETGRAGVRFIDRSRIYMASNTLVVIYGTASQTAVSKTPPPAVELNRGEVQAGLAALRGDSVEVAVQGGGRVSAASRDTVVARKGKRTRVAVFDGTARVASAGQRVSVPTNHGTDFHQGKPPKPPRPLPPAPAWREGGSGIAVLASPGQGQLEAGWQAVPRARAYRFEVASERSFASLLVREEVGADVLAFRGERMPAGTYYLRVRAIDDEEYLGIASAVRTVELIDAAVKVGGGQVEQSRVRVSPYGVLTLTASERLELAIDDGPFSPMLPEIDLQRVTPQRLRLRVRGSLKVQTIAVDYVDVSATVRTAEDSDTGTLGVDVSFSGLEQIDVGRRVAPALRVHLPDRVVGATLAPGQKGAWSASVPLSGSARGIRIDVVDGRGRVLGSTVVGEPSGQGTGQGPSVPPGKTPERPLAIGSAFPVIALSRHTNVAWISPTAPTSATVTTVLGLDRDDALGVQGQAAASGQIGPIGIDALLRTGSSPSGAIADTNAWLGARWRIVRFDVGAIELGPSLRLGLPVDNSSPPAQLEPAFALGGRSGRWSWLTHAGARIRLHDSEDRSAVAPGQAFMLGGGAVELLSLLRAQAMLDGHLFIDDGVDGSGGLAAGLELGEQYFLGLGARLSPFGRREGIFSSQLTLGIREW